MGDRFYQQQLDVIGTCPGFKGRRKKLAWDDEKKAKAIELYEKEEPTPETSMEIVNAVAEELDESPNGVRRILSVAGVYIKKDPAAAAREGGSTGTTSTRVSKAAAQEALTEAIVAMGATVDEDIISKLTGKAAVYFEGILKEAKD